ncbi:hypothetical protein Cal7507_0609 [Calothrix sp. PCC 7507]|nr:hypothetical protein Cal7507_0609 [Calothrix sp. PCC 7507]
MVSPKNHWYLYKQLDTDAFLRNFDKTTFFEEYFYKIFNSLRTIPIKIRAERHLVKIRQQVT